MNKERIAIVPGSFDPMTNGHISIVKRAIEDYDRVYVAVMINNEKRYMFSLEEREEIAKACLKDLPKAEVISSRDWLWRLCIELDACAIVKGYRNENDLEYERKMAEFNKEHCPTAETVLIKSDALLSDLSSTVVRKLIFTGKDLHGVMPDEAIEVIKKIKPMG